MDSRSKCSHNLNLDDHTFTCPVCAFRAVLTTDGRIVLTQAGEPGHDHIGQARAMVHDRRAYTEAIMERLRHHYADQDDIVMTVAQMQRLYRCVMTEGYGL